MEWLLLFVVVLVVVCISARRAYNRDIKAMTPEEREEERYQQQSW
jgi:heme exporter protein D